MATVQALQNLKTPSPKYIHVYMYVYNSCSPLQTFWVQVNIAYSAHSAQNNQNAMLGHFGRPFSVFDNTEQELYMWQDWH